MNKLKAEYRAQILHLLVEGSSIRAITRLTGASKNTVMKLLEDAGRACAAYHDRVVRNLQSKRVQVDEIWSFVYAKNANVRTAKYAKAEAGDAWTWTAIDADSKLLISWLVSGRDATSAEFFLTDVRSRLTNRVQLTSDGHRPYLQAVDAAFGDDVDYAMLVKHYGTAPEGERRYSEEICLGATKRRVTGNTERRYVSTSYAERQKIDDANAYAALQETDKRVQQETEKRYCGGSTAQDVLQFHTHRSDAEDDKSNGRWRDGPPLGDVRPRADARGLGSSTRSDRA